MDSKTVWNRPPITSPVKPPDYHHEHEERKDLGNTRETQESGVTVWTWEPGEKDQPKKLTDQEIPEW